MIILRIFLYLICILSIGWSALVFGGPIILTKIITNYTNGSLMPSEITISPTLDIKISRLDFKLENKNFETPIAGFSRATKISWSLLKEKPFLSLNFGPTVVQDYATAEKIHVNIPTFRKIDWENIFLELRGDGVSITPLGYAETVDLIGNLNLSYSTLSNISVHATTVSSHAGSSAFTSELIKGKLTDMRLDTTIEAQTLSGIFSIEDIKFAEPKISTQSADIEFALRAGDKKYDIDFYQVDLPNFGGFIKKASVSANFDHGNFLKDLAIDLSDGVFAKQLPSFKNISTKVFKMPGQKYDAKIKGNLDQFEISNSDNFLGLLPPSNFFMDLKLDNSISKVSAVSGFRFDMLEAAEIYGSMELAVSSKHLKSMRCSPSDCELSDLDLAFQISLDEEWIKGGAQCQEIFCNISKIDYSVKTSNTANILAILSKANILSPLSALYLYGAISAGQKVKSGHELKFQF